MRRLDPDELWYGLDLSRAVRNGLSIVQIAKGSGRSRHAVRAALNRRRLKAPVHTLDYRQTIIGLSKDDAITYLLDCIELLTGETCSEHRELAILCGCTPGEARVLNFLYKNRGRTVSFQSVYDYLYFDRRDADMPSDIGNIVQIFVCKIRKKLPKDVGEIKNCYGFGYTFVEHKDCPKFDFEETDHV